MDQDRDATTDARAPVRVFLSYARVDRDRADRITALLQDAGVTVWWDAMIEGGAQFARSIHDALEAADVVVVLWSRASIESDWVRDEAATGRDRHRLVPVSLDGSEPPLGFRQYQAVDLSAWRGDADAADARALVRAVHAAAGQPEAGVASRPVPRRSRRAVIAGAGGVAIAAAVGGYVARRQGLFGAAVAGDSIAIMPLANVGGDPAQAYLASGLTSELRTALARNDALKVMAGTSSGAASAGGDDAKTVAHRLGVAYVLDGSVQRAGERVRISVNLTDGHSGYGVWSQQFDRQLADIFAVQTEVADTVAQAMAVQVATSAPAPGGTTDVGAYEAYLRGRALFDAAKDEASDRAALTQFDLAIAGDPRFALAYAARSRVLAAIAAEYAPADQLATLNGAAVDAAERAVALTPRLAEGQLALGYALFTGRLDPRGARGPYDRALELGHGSADVLLLFALYAVRVGRGAEAVTAITRALALDPLNPRTYRAAGSIRYALRRYPAALEHLHRAIALNPAISNAYALIGNCLYQLGQYRQARDAYAKEPHGFVRLTGLAIVDRKLRDDAAAQAAFDELVRTLGDSALYQQAQVLAQWGDTQRALATLVRARAASDSGLLYMTTDPMLDPLRRTPAFRALAADLGLT